MRRSRLFFFAALAVAIAVIAMPSANAAVTVHLVGVGSSAIWTTAALAAYNLSGGSTNGAQHYTIKGSCTSGNCAQIHDVRSASILLEGGNLWVVWNSAQTAAFAYISVDSVIGVRAFFAQPRAQLEIDPETETTTAGQNLIASSLWGTDAPSIPAAIYNALNNAAVTAAFTTNRPEDMKMAECRVASALGAALPTGYYGSKGLGYGTSCTTIQPASIQSYVVPGTTADPVDFNLTGTDPITGDAIPGFATLEVGATPLVFFINRSNANGLGQPGFFTNMAQGNLQSLFSGADCESNAFGDPGPLDVPVVVVLREPLSGTMNTTEYTTFYTSSSHVSQETGINLADPNTNPLDLTCTAGGGVRVRAIGTSQEVAGVKSNTFLPNPDTIGYIFFSYGNVSSIAGSPDYGYLQFNGVDPINASYTNGELPTCTPPR